MKLALTLAVLLVGTATGVALAQDDVIAKRKELMKEIGKKAELAGDIIKGKTPYSKEAAAGIFTTFDTNTKDILKLFPADSDLGDTKALPEIWTDWATFEAGMKKFRADVAENAPKAATADGFKAAFMAVAEDCRACHQKFKTR